jgi:hypothetical protein
MEDKHCLLAYIPACLPAPVDGCSSPNVRRAPERRCSSSVTRCCSVSCRNEQCVSGTIQKVQVPNKVAVGRVR